MFYSWNMPLFHIIDDEPTLCELAVELISSIGFKAVSYSDPVEYLSYMNSDAYVVPTAIFTDIQMPEMNGYDLIDKIREKYPDQKVIVVSGYSGVEAYKRKVWQFLPKPYLPDQLIALVNDMVQYNEEVPNN